ncbi:hypothetical protein PGB90_005271 [Kerria lacca]
MILKEKTPKKLSLWNKSVLFKKSKKYNWNNFLIVVKGMLHQLTSQQYSNLNNHYLSLNNCSHLLKETYVQSSKISEINEYVVGQNTYFYDEKEHNEGKNQLPAQSLSQIQSKLFDSEETAMNCETKKMVLPCKLFEQTITNEEFDAETNQLITNDEQNKNAQKLEFKNISYGYQKYESKKEENDLLSFIDLDMETIINTPVNENECNRKIRTTANEIHKICDENESNFRLPGFHQAFGSTEIGRFVHQKDFIEQIASQPTPLIYRNKATLVTNNSSNSRTSCGSDSNSGNASVSLNSLTGLNNIANLNNSKMKPRYNKRIKAPPLEGAERNVCWKYEGTECDHSVCATTANSIYCNRKDLRRAKNQVSVNSSILGYCGSDEHYVSCSSPSSSSSSPYYMYVQSIIVLLSKNRYLIKKIFLCENIVRLPHFPDSEADRIYVYLLKSSKAVSLMNISFDKCEYFQKLCQLHVVLNGFSD